MSTNINKPGHFQVIVPSSEDPSKPAAGAAAGGHAAKSGQLNKLAHAAAAPTTANAKSSHGAAPTDAFSQGHSSPGTQTRPGDGSAPLPHDSAASAHNSNLTTALRLLGSDIDSMIEMTQELQSKDDVAGLRSQTAQLAKQAQSTDQFNKKFSKILSEVVGEVGKGQGQMCQHDLVQDNATKDLENKLEKLGLSPDSARDLLMGVQKGGAAGMALAIGLASTLAGGGGGAEKAGKHHHKHGGGGDSQDQELSQLQQLANLATNYDKNWLDGNALFGSPEGPATDAILKTVFPGTSTQTSDVLMKVLSQATQMLFASAIDSTRTTALNHVSSSLSTDLTSGHTTRIS